VLLLAGCAPAIPQDALRSAHFAVESEGGVYLLDGAGERSVPVLTRRRTRDGPSHLDELYDVHAAPALSPDGSHVACLRARNHAPYRSGGDLISIQSTEVLLVRLADGAEQVVVSIPAARRGSVLLAPVWAADSARVYFGADHRVWAYALGASAPEPIVEIPADFYGDFRLRGYLRLSRGGAALFALLERRNPSFATYDVIVRIDLADRTVTPLWTGKLSHGSVFEVDRPLSREIGSEVGGTLFGSRERPVYAPLPSEDGRFYFFRRHEMGLFGRRWVAGYDRVTRREFEVRTMWRALFWK
jgi:hypothetical protein